MHLIFTQYFKILAIEQVGFAMLWEMDSWRILKA